MDIINADTEAERVNTATQPTGNIPEYNRHRLYFKSISIFIS